MLELIRRADGATLKEIMAATAWQAHSVRGFISGSLGKKMGLNVESFKRADGERAYSIAIGKAKARTRRRPHIAGGVSVPQLFHDSLQPLVDVLFAQLALAGAHVRPVDPRDDAVLQFRQFLPDLGQQRPVLQSDECADQP